MPSPSFSASSLVTLLVVLELLFSYRIAGMSHLIEASLPVVKDSLFVQPKYFVMYALIDGSLVCVSTIMISPLHSRSLCASSVFRNPPTSLILQYTTTHWSQPFTGHLLSATWPYGEGGLKYH